MKNIKTCLDIQKSNIANLEKLIDEDFWKYVEKNEIEIYNEFSLQHELGFFLRLALDGFKVQFERNIDYFFDDGNLKGKLERKYGLKKDDDTEKYVKHEIDIVLFNEDYSSCHAIELKYPRNGRHPETMYDCIKDIRFMEQLKESGFESAHCITLIDKCRDSKKKSLKLSLFCSGKTKGNKKIYGYIRSNETPAREHNKYTSRSFKSDEKLPSENIEDAPKSFRANEEIPKDESIEKPTGAGDDSIKLSDRYGITWVLEGGNWVRYTVSIKLQCESDEIKKD